MIYLDIVRHGLRDLEQDSYAARRVVYQQLRDALAGVLDEQGPGSTAQERTIELRLLEMTIRQVEGDVRAGVDVMSAEYQPSELEAEQTRLYALKAASRQVATAASTQAQADVVGYADQLMRHIKPISHASTPLNYHENPLRLCILKAVTLRMLRNQAAAQGKFGLLWIIIEPMILVALIVSAYLFTGQKSVVNMPLIAFAITGIVPWLMLRVTATRVASSFISNRELLAFPAVNMLTIAISTGLLQFIIYTIGLIAALSVLIFRGDAPAPDNWAGVLAVIICLWIYSVAGGMILGSFAITRPVLLRAFVISTRFIGFISSVFVVSEQIPEEYKFITLVNPLSHGFQLLRSEYFLGYQSTDANLSYLIFWLAVTVVVAVVVEYARRPMLEPS